MLTLGYMFSSTYFRDSHSNFKEHQFQAITRFMADLPTSLNQNTMKDLVLVDLKYRNLSSTTFTSKYFNPNLPYLELVRYL